MHALIIEETLTVQSDDWDVAIKFLDDRLDLSKSKLKDAMNKGCVWLTRKNQRTRLRRAKTQLFVGDQVSVFYDEAQLSPIPKETDLIEDMGQYSVWFKPAGMDVQGSDWGDFNTLVRQVELMCHGERKVLPVFNMATEAGGLMVIAHDKRAAADLTALFQKGDVEKRYRIEVRGQCESGGEMTLEANGVSMPSRYTPVTYNDHSNTSKVDVFTASSEAPIRHYFDSLSTPIMGDPEYGEDNISRSGMQLKLADIAFECPVTNQPVSFSLYS